jgi:hypothetical protein
MQRLSVAALFRLPKRHRAIDARSVNFRPQVAIYEASSITPPKVMIKLVSRQERL